MSDKETMREIQSLRFISAFLLSALFSLEGWAGAPLVFSGSASYYQTCKNAAESHSGPIDLRTQTQRDEIFNTCMESYAAAAASVPEQAAEIKGAEAIAGATKRGSGTTNKSAGGGAANNTKNTNQNVSSGGVENLCGSGSSCPSDQECVMVGTKSKSFQCMPKAESPKAAAHNNGEDSSTGSSQDQVTSCQAQYQQLYEACKADTESAVSACDEKNNGSMSQVTKVAKQASLMLGQATAASANAACSKAGDLSAMANAAVAAYATYCGNGRDSCLNSCQQAKALLREKGEGCFSLNVSEGSNILDRETDNVGTQLKSCSALSSKVSDAQQAISNYGQTLMQSSQCAALTASGELNLCKSNPNLPGCVAVSTECTSQACICAKSPSDPSCTGINTGGGGGIVGGGADGSSRLTGQNSDNVSINGDLPSTGIEQGVLNKSGTGAAIDGKQGGGSGIGGGGGGGSGVAGGRGGGPGEKDPTSVNSGFYGGGGGGGFGGGGSASGGGRGYAGNGGVNAKNAGPNLRAFLPGGKFDPRAMRGIAGATGPDGITGPNTDIWQKVQNRYQSMSPTFLP